MITRSVMLQTLCVPCACHCRYCLLSWNGKTPGLDYEQSAAYAKAFHQWISRERPGLTFHFSFGYSMDHPQLPRAVAFLNSIGSVTGKYLQLDGMAFRSPGEMAALLNELRENGAESLNFTFYGLPAYHDTFAGRRGDFQFMLSTLGLARTAGFQVTAGIPLTRESAPQAEELVSLLRGAGVERPRLFIPHEEGRGASLSGIRFSTRDAEGLPPALLSLLNQNIYQPESQWMGQRPLPPEENRALLISLTPDNFSRYQAMDFAAVIAEAEALDEAYYSALPDLNGLLSLYGDPQGTGYYSRRDLTHHYQKRYIREHALNLYDVTDERQTGSRRD